MLSDSRPCQWRFVERTTLILGVHTTSFQMLVQHVFSDFCLHSELQIQVGELYISSHVHILYIYTIYLYKHG